MSGSATKLEPECTVPSPEQRIADAFELIAQDCGEEKWRRWAAELRRQPRRRGPKVIDDSAALAKMESLVEIGTPIETAARFIMSTIVNDHNQSPEATTRRLAKKFRASRRT